MCKLVEYIGMPQDILQDCNVTGGTETNGILWLNIAQRTIPILIIPNADQIYQQLKDWTNNDIPDYFNISTETIKNDDIVMILYPDNDNCDEKLFHAAMNHDPTLYRSVKTVYRPIAWASPKNTQTYQYLKEQQEIDAVTTVGMLDPKHIHYYNKNTVANLKHLKILGHFILQHGIDPTLWETMDKSYYIDEDDDTDIPF